VGSAGGRAAKGQAPCTVQAPVLPRALAPALALALALRNGDGAFGLGVARAAGRGGLGGAGARVSAMPNARNRIYWPDNREIAVQSRGKAHENADLARERCSISQQGGARSNSCALGERSVVALERGKGRAPFALVRCALSACLSPQFRRAPGERGSPFPVASALAAGSALDTARLSAASLVRRLPYWVLGDLPHHGRGGGLADWRTGGGYDCCFRAASPHRVLPTPASCDRGVAMSEKKAAVAPRRSLPSALSSPLLCAGCSAAAPGQ